MKRNISLKRKSRKNNNNGTVKCQTTLNILSASIFAKSLLYIRHLQFFVTFFWPKTSTVVVLQRLQMK